MVRVKRSKQQWQQLIEAQQASALTIKQFCDEHNITVSNFYLQRKKYRERATPKVEPTDDWLPLNTLAQTQRDERHWQIELTLPNGVVLNMRTTSEC